MHHAIMGKPPKGLMRDHIDGNTLNNQRYNLRFVTSRQNNQNRKNINKSSKYPGISWHKRDKIWQSRILINCKRKHLGYFNTEAEAFNAYKQAVEAIGETVLMNETMI